MRTKFAQSSASENKRAGRADRGWLGNEQVHRSPFRNPQFLGNIEVDQRRENVWSGNVGGGRGAVFQHSPSSRANPQRSMSHDADPAQTSQLPKPAAGEGSEAVRPNWPTVQGDNRTYWPIAAIPRALREKGTRRSSLRTRTEAAKLPGAHARLTELFAQQMLHRSNDFRLQSSVIKFQ